ncbi:hypothetical protein AB6T85_23585 [Erwinia sp. ACCC 02193]|uniref:DUF5681 domain-containing protein n=1 Tax=Erwinia aeris TaxID=3239803 RepID=A0ABV4EES7_9GAMM
MKAPRKPAPPRRKATDETNGHLTGRAASLAAIEPHKFQKGQPRPAGAGRKKRATAQSLLDELVETVEADIAAGKCRSAGKSVQVALLQRLLDYSPQVAAEIAKRILPAPPPRQQFAPVVIDDLDPTDVDSIEAAIIKTTAMIAAGGDIASLSAVQTQLRQLLEDRMYAAELRAVELMLNEDLMRRSR